MLKKMELSDQQKIYMNEYNDDTSYIKTDLSQGVVSDEDLALIIEDFYRYAKTATPSFYKEEKWALANGAMYMVPPQQQICEAIIKSVFQNLGWTINVYITRQAFKTTTIALVFNYIFYKYYKIFNKPFSGAIVAHNQKVVNNVTQRVEAGMRQNNIPFIRERTRGEKETANGDTFVPLINGESGAESNNEGYTLDLCVRDECHRGLDKNFRDEIQPSLYKTNGTLVNLGNGFFAKCDFWRNRNRGNTKKNKVFWYSYNELREMALRLSEYGFRSWGSWVEKIDDDIDFHGEDDPEIRKNVFLQDAFESRALLLDSDIEACHDFYLDKIEEEKLPLFVGIDIARIGDRTVMTIVDINGKFVDRVIIKGKNVSMNFPEQFEKMYDHLDNNKYLDRVEAIGIDSTGMGLIALDYAEELFECPVTKIVFTQRSKQNMYEQVSDFIKNKIMKVDPLHPTYKEFAQEWTEIEVNMGADGSRKYNAPPGKNDDIVAADAVAVEIWVQNKDDVLNNKTHLRKKKGDRLNELEKRLAAMDRAMSDQASSWNSR